MSVHTKDVNGDEGNPQILQITRNCLPLASSWSLDEKAVHEWAANAVHTAVAPFETRI